MVEGISNRPKEGPDQAAIEAIREIIERIPNAYSYDKVRAIVAKRGSSAIQMLQADLEHAPKGQLKEAVEAWYKKFEAHQ